MHATKPIKNRLINTLLDNIQISYLSLLCFIILSSKAIPVLKVPHKVLKLSLVLLFLVCVAC